MREFYEGQGAGMDAFMNAVSRRVALGDSADGKLLDKMNDALFNLNYLNSITRAGQEAFVDILTQDIARQIAKGEWNSRTIATLESFGITAKEMELFSKGVIETPDGITRFDVSKIGDADVERKFREYMMHFMQDAILTPDAGAQAMARLNLQSGTWLGEAARSLFQYMSFPLAMTRSTTRRFMLDHNGNNAWTSRQTSMIHMTSFVGSMFAMAYMATIIKDLARGKPPILLHQMSSFDASRLVAQSGTLGILEVMLGIGGGRIAPLPAMAGDAAKALVTDGPRAAIYAARPLAGSAYPVIGPMVTKALTPATAESIVEAQNRFY